ncbi:hypothetical protein CBS14141_001757 [Malassezia furfur]|nr:hypothetical protein CBS14141_001757 [Malassezia furfur]
MQRADLEASLAHIRAAEQSLRAALGEGENEENMELPHDLPAAYTKLLKDYRALCAQYENERKVWLEFKDWWRSRIRERRAKKQHEVEYKDKDVMSSPSSRRKPRSPHKKRASPEHGAPKESVTIPSPHRSRERILEHRSQYYALVGRASTFRAEALSPTDETRKQISSRHRHMQQQYPTPPDYWQLGFPSSGEALEINRRARAE